MINLNKEQYEASQALQGAVMVLAGAGSGKTRVLTQRIANLIDSGVYPHNILAITFTNKAATEMKNRLSATCDVRGMTICTIHSMCSRILREDADKLGYSKNFTIYDSTDSKRVLKKVAKKLISDSDTADKVVASAEVTISKTKNEGIDLEDYLTSSGVATDHYGELIVAVAKEYRQQLLSSDSMDFDDLLYNVYCLFKDFPEILQKYRNRYKYVSIDEFQDTNTVQYKIFRQIAGEDGNIFVVGDDDQSIYGWRGAQADNMHKFRKDYKDVKVFYLEQNYRSTKKILTAANNLIKKNDNRFDKTLWTDNSDGVRVESYTAMDEADEARYCLQQISALRTRGYKYSDFAILMRINAISRSFEQECMSYGVPFKVFGGFKFFERKEIKDVVSYLRLVVNPHDNEAFLRAISTRKGIGDTSIAKLTAYAEQNGKTLLESLDGIEDAGVFTKNIAFKFSDFFQKIKILAGMTAQYPLEKVASQAVVFSGITQELRTEEDRSRAENLNEFCLSAAEFAENNPDAGLLEFLESISLKSDLDEMDESDYVSIATIHSAKGLEWKVVFVVGMDEGIFPGNRALLDVAQMQEERRLAYVATTRACERLFVTHTSSRFLYGNRQYTTQSRFFTDIAGEPQRVQRYDEDGVPMFDIPVRSDKIVANRASVSQFTSSFTSSASSSIVRPTANKDAGNLRVGQKVMHQTYGEGMILNLSNGNADVVFVSVGKKVLNLKYAPLTPLD